MWEQIRINRRNSVILLTVMAVLLLSVGGVIGYAWMGPQAAMPGMLVAAVIWLVMTLVSFSAGDQILLASSGAIEVTEDVHPMLFNIVEEMKIAAQLPAMPKIYIIPDASPNAFATGRSPQHCAVAVTEGLLAKLNRDQLQGVIAHEISHILHRDIMFVTLAGIMLGSIVLLSNVFMRGTLYGGGRRRYSSDRGNGGAQAIIVLIALLVAILAPLMAQILYFALSRKREYLADAGAVRLTRYPEGLAGALEKIASSQIPVATANKVTAPMYISNPFRGSQASLFSTHPPIAERVAILRNISQGVGFQEYNRAYESTTGKAGVIPPTALTQKDSAPIRSSAESAPQTTAEKARQHIRIGDFIRQKEGFETIACPCGVKLKLPPNFKAPQAQCPRCKTIHTLKN